MENSVIAVPRAALAAAVKALEIAFDHDCGGDVFGVSHNDAADALDSLARLLADKKEEV